MSEYKPIDECKTVVELLAIPKRWAKNPGPRCDCVATAIGWIYPHYSQQQKAKVRFLEAVGLSTDGDGVDLSTRIYDWNDAPARTHAEVLAACRKAGI